MDCPHDAVEVTQWFRRHKAMKRLRLELLKALNFDYPGGWQPDDEDLEREHLIAEAIRFMAAITVGKSDGEIARIVLGLGPDIERSLVELLEGLRQWNAARAG